MNLKDLQKKYGISFTAAIALHAVLFIVLFTSIIFSTKLPYVVKKSNTKIVNAVAINQQQVQKEVAKLKAEQRAKKHAQEERLRRLERQAYRAKQTRVEEQRRLARLREEQRIKQRQAQEQLAKIRQQRQAQQKQLAALQQQSDAAKKHYQQEQQRLAKLKQQQTLKQKLSQQRKNDVQDLLQQQINQEQQQLKQARAQYVNGVVDKYKALIIQAISQKWLVPPNANKNLKSILAIHLAPGGSVLKVSLFKSSGDAALDRSAIAAVYKASPLPVPGAQSMFNQFRQFDLVVSPQTVLQG